MAGYSIDGPRKDGPDCGVQRQRVKRRRTTRLFAATLAIAVSFILTACGARIDTAMTIKNDGSGSRVMTLALSAKDVSRLKGGTAAVDISIRSHLPKELIYSGIQAKSDGSRTGKITLNFSSVADYRGKVKAILQAGGVGNFDNVFSVSDSILVRGFHLQESYSSADLLKWLFVGLTADGVISSNDASNVYELGSSKVNYGGTVHDTPNQLNVEDIVNNGFDKVSMETKITDPEHITRIIKYVVTNARYEKNKAVLSKYISGATPSGAEMKAGSGTWTITFSGNKQEIEADTTTALGGAKAQFTLDFVDTPGNPSEKLLSFVDFASCDAVCGSVTPIVDKVLFGSGYAPSTRDIEASTSEPTLFVYAPPITSVSAKYGIGFDGSVTANIDFIVPNTSVDAVGDGFEQFLTPKPGVGTVGIRKTGDSTLYTVTIAEKDANSFNKVYEQWAQGGSLEAVEVNSSWFTRNTSYAIATELSGLIGNHEVTDGVTTQLTLPFGSWAENTPDLSDKSAGIAGATVTVKAFNGPLYVDATGLNIGGIIVLIVILAASTVGILLLVRKRQVIAAGISTVRGKFEGALVEQHLLAGEVRLFATPTGHGGSLLNVSGVVVSVTSANLFELPVEQIAPHQGSLLDISVACNHRVERKPSLLGDGTNPTRDSLLS